MAQGTQVGEDGITRCWWPGAAEDYVAYHDDEWGRPVVDDTRLFEKICLEGFQSGLSWITILRKRENFRRAFAGFDPAKVAAFGEADVLRMLDDAGIVRHQGKIRSSINNAARALELIEERGSLAAYFWSWEPTEIEGDRSGEWPIPSTTPTSIAIAKDLKKRGWSFVGPTTVYAFMQAMGLVNDHLPGCAAGVRCDAERSALARPT
ncbi:MAG: DNA-3-methyladenine glycosylase I [Acidimicrobiales bacterium]|nr:MAG: DNA-3-methyladenine glycosylase I [Acidimicrobiales bacterium]